MDDQSLFGKACMGVAGKAREANVPAVALVGSTGPGAEDCLAAGLTEIVVIGAGLPAKDSISNVAELLANAAAAARSQIPTRFARMLVSQRQQFAVRHCFRARRMAGSSGTCRSVRRRSSNHSRSAPSVPYQ